MTLNPRFEVAAMVLEVPYAAWKVISRRSRIRSQSMPGRQRQDAQAKLIVP
jgi:hypothetical protein